MIFWRSRASRVRPGAGFDEIKKARIKLLLPRARGLRKRSKYRTVIARGEAPRQSRSAI